MALVRMKQPVLLLTAAGLLTGCAATLAPHTPYIPVVRDRGQAEARLSTGLNGTELQLGYQLTEHLVLNTSLLNTSLLNTPLLNTSLLNASLLNTSSRRPPFNAASGPQRRHHPD